MKKEFVPYELAVKLKVLGFDEPCFCFYQIEYAEIRPTMVDDDEQYRLTGYRTCKNSEIPEHYTSAPTFSQAFRFFREKHDYLHEISKTIGGEYIPYANGLELNTNNERFQWIYNTYEEAELACLEKLIEIVPFAFMRGRTFPNTFVLVDECQNITKKCITGW